MDNKELVKHIYRELISLHQIKDSVLTGMLLSEHPGKENLEVIDAKIEVYEKILELIKEPFASSANVSIDQTGVFLDIDQTAAKVL